MGVYRKIINLERKIEKCAFSKMVSHLEKKKILKKEKIYKKIKLTNHQENEIQEFYKKYYGKKIDTRWHRLYQSYTGTFDKKYFPEILFSSKLEPLLNDRTLCNILEDKAFVELLYKDVDNLKIPKTYVLSCNNILYDGDRRLISRDKALEILENSGKIIIKKTVDSSSGKGVQLCNFKNGKDIISGLSIKKIIDNFDKNFIIQKQIKNCKELAALNSSSLNTLRIITYICNKKIFHMPLALRIGRNGNYVDNMHANGLGIGLNEEGKLKPIAYSEFQETFTEHPDSHIKFDGYVIPKIKEVLKIAYRCHEKTPYVNIISWDFAIDEFENINLIEANMYGHGIWFPQMVNGESAFGDNTEYMLSLIRK